jgi:flagellar motility protein MotE (MotC chaperone)
MNKLLSSTWISAPLGVLIYLATTVAFWEQPKMPPRSVIDRPIKPIGPSWEFSNPEADQLIAELRSEKKSLDLREQQLDELSTRLQSERGELGQVTQSVRQLEADFDNSVLQIKGDEAINLKKLAKVYAAMSPDSAAIVLTEMDNAAVAKILFFLKEEETGAILEAMAKQGDAPARRAAQISDLMRLSTHDHPTK